MQKLIPALLLILMTPTLHAALPEPLHLDAGLVTGTASLAPDIRAYKGIPYAAPPVGPLRWHAPLPPAPWTGILHADHFGPACIQPPFPPGSFYQQEYFQNPPPKMSEDCLYLNVWTGASSPTERRPVMVFIHGGGGVQGYTAEPVFDGTALAQHGVVLVSFNYRLGIIGLFAHPELSAESPHHVSGNYAELDHLAALQWVQRNIASFGGDPANVTIFGQSSGAASINRLLVCPLAKGLFQKVILESAAVLNSKDSKTRLPAMEARGTAFAAALGAASLADLRAKPAAEILAASQKMKFDPTIDGYILPDLAANLFDKGSQFPVPMLIGSNSDEGAFTPITAGKFRVVIQQRFGSLTDQFLALYPAATDAQAAQSKHDARRDESFAGERAEARAQSKLHVPVYLYYFSRKSPGRDSEKYGAFHTAELEYVFNTLSATDRPWQKKDHDLATALITYWTNFAKSANPNDPSLPNWPQYDPATDQSMELGDTLAPRHAANVQRLNFLESFLTKDAR